MNVQTPIAPLCIRVALVLDDQPKTLDEIAAATEGNLAAVHAEIALLEIDGWAYSTLDGWKRGSGATLGDI